jgi:hypothetical protein
MLNKTIEEKKTYNELTDLLGLALYDIDQHRSTDKIGCKELILNTTMKRMNRILLLLSSLKS